MDTSALVVGTVGEHSRTFHAAHRDSNDTPVTTTVMLTVPMSHEDVEGALWQLLRDEGVSFDDLADDGIAAWLLLDSIIGRGTGAVESYRLDLADLTPADPDYRHFLRLRRRVEELIGPRPGSRPTRRGRKSVPPCSASAATRGQQHSPPPGAQALEEVPGPMSSPSTAGEGVQVSNRRVGRRTRPRSTAVAP